MCIRDRTPAYRHHLLLIAEEGGKLAKLHGSIPASRVRRAYDGPSLCGALARACGLRPTATPITPAALLADFAWARVRTDDVRVIWRDDALISMAGDAPRGIGS